MVEETEEGYLTADGADIVSPPEQAVVDIPKQKLTIVTGGAGFIGSHLIKELNIQGREDILLVDDLSDPRKLHNINTLKFQDYVDKSKFIEVFGFIAEAGMVERIYHLGAESSRLCTDGKYIMENNYQYTCNIMDICSLHKIPLVYASSAAVYGNQYGGQINKRSFNDKSDDYIPESFYAFSKLQTDKYSRKFHLPNLQNKIIGLRYFNVISEGEHEQHKDEGKSPLCWMKEQYENNGCIELFEGSRKFSRDFIPIEDAVNMTIKAMEAGRSGIYNVGIEKAKTFYDFAKDIAGIAETNIHFIPMPSNIAQGYQGYTKADMSNAWNYGRPGNPKT
jgi:ADP-L-glycero-D-manno-heptose 6-epimerase